MTQLRVRSGAEVTHRTQYVDHSDPRHDAAAVAGWNRGGDDRGGRRGGLQGLDIETLCAVGQKDVLRGIRRRIVDDYDVANIGAFESGRRVLVREVAAIGRESHEQQTDRRGRCGAEEAEAASA